MVRRLVDSPQNGDVGSEHGTFPLSLLEAVETGPLPGASIPRSRERGRLEEADSSKDRYNFF